MELRIKPKAQPTNGLLAFSGTGCAWPGVLLAQRFDCFRERRLLGHHVPNHMPHEVPGHFWSAGNLLDRFGENAIERSSSFLDLLQKGWGLPNSLICSMRSLPKFGSPAIPSIFLISFMSSSSAPLFSRLRQETST